jgi:hypothetical protein
VTISPAAGARPAAHRSPAGTSSSQARTTASTAFGSLNASSRSNPRPLSAVADLKPQRPLRALLYPGTHDRQADARERHTPSILARRDRGVTAGSAGQQRG